MRSTEVYNFIQVYRAPKEKKAYQARTTKSGKDYFLCPVGLPAQRQLTIDGNVFNIINQHVSIYADPKLKEQAYHLTIRVSQGPNEFVIHCYFDAKGNPCSHDTITIKADKVPLPTPMPLSADAQKMLRTYSVQHAGLIQTLNKDLVAKQDELQEKIEKNQKRVADLFTNYMSHLKDYITALRELIDLIKEFNFISNHSMRGEQNLLEQRLSACERMQESFAKKAGKKKTISPKTASQKPVAVVKEEKSEKQKAEVKQTVTLKSINAELAALKVKNLATQLKQQELLETKLKLIPKENEDLILKTINELDNVNIQIRNDLFEQASKGDIEAAKKIISSNYFVKRVFYYVLVFRGHEEIFDMFFKRASQLNVFIDASMIITQDNTPHCLLELAYLKKHESIFRKLLFTYHCNPNAVTISGNRLLHITAQQGKVIYAKMLLEAGADVNVMVKTAKIVSLTDEDNPYISVAQATQDERYSQIVQDFNKKKEETQAPSNTPLMCATIHSHREIVRLLVEEYKADVTLRGQLGLDAIGAHASTRINTLDATLLLTLVKAGASIDSINKTELQDYSMLDYRCKFLDEKGVRLLVNQFAADPNVLLIKRKNKESKSALTTCFTMLLGSLFSSATQEKATHIFLFLLDQDIKPLTSFTLDQSIAYLKQIIPESSSLSEAEIAIHEISAKAALEKREYEVFYAHSEAKRTSYSSDIRQAILKNRLKLDLIRAAETDLGKSDYHHCINACETILRAKFNIQQYNERLWATYSKAHLHLGNDEQACRALEHYLRILTQKSSQVLSPKYKTEVNKKIAEASAQLAEAQERLLSRTASLGGVMHRAHLFHSRPSPKAPDQSQIAKKHAVLTDLQSSVEDMELRASRMG